jgi:hypothetical protein
VPKINSAQHNIGKTAFTDKSERNCHLPTPDKNSMTDHEVLQDFPDTSQVSLHKNNIVNLQIIRGTESDVHVVAALRFVYERSV